MLTKVVGLTGGIGSGKSSVRKQFEQLGVPAWDADVVARRIHQNPDHAVQSTLRKVFGQVHRTDGTLDIVKMRMMLVQDETASEKLRHALRPYVLSDLQAKTEDSSAAYVVWESALIVEEKLKVDRVLLVDCSVATQRSRVRARNPDWADADIDGMLNLQLGRQERLAHCDDLLLNDGLESELAAKVAELNKRYHNRWSTK